MPAAMPVPRSKILVNASFNCRGEIPATQVINLAQSIEKQGLISPVVVCELSPSERLKNPGKEYKLIAGFRREKAHEVLKRETIDAIVKPYMSDIEARLVNLTENLERKDLNILQEAKAIQVLAEIGLNKQKEIPERLGQSYGWVQVRFMLLELPEDIQQEAAAGILGQHNIRDLYGMRHNVEDLYASVRQIKDQKAKGEKSIRVRPKESPVVKRRRDAAEVYKLICFLLSTTGPGLTTRALAWANGEISDHELYQTIGEVMVKLGKPYKIPEIAIANMSTE